MKKKVLSLAVAAGLSGVMAGAAHAAMHINDKGMGEALVYPFYSAEGGNDTYIHVVNTTNYTKAVKVRFIEAFNSAEVLDFNLYLSPNDEWAAAITATDEGGAKVVTADTSCTVPALGTPNPPFDGHIDDRGLRHQPFTNNEIIRDGDFGPPEENVDNMDVSRTTQGYVEIFEMGQLVPGSALSDAAIHDAEGVPANCGAIEAAWLTAGGAWNTSNGDAQLLEWGTGEDGPSAGGLWGYGVLINVEEGTTASYDAIAIDSFFSGAGSNLHFAPGDLQPNFGNAGSVATIFNEGVATDYPFANGLDAVSALFMTSTLSNDYIVSPGLNASTDWVINMPTKRNYITSTPVGEPFSVAWNSENLTACEKVALEHWDREEGYTPPPPSYNFSPIRPGQGPGGDPVLCTEVSILSFGEESAVHAAGSIANYFDPSYNEGWARMSFLPEDLNNSTGVSERIIRAANEAEFRGLPVVGFAVMKYQNGTLNGGSVLSNYASSVKHKTTLEIDLD